ncbi:hypothetical protein R1sor_004046 [Riccia sorocarpa]|uniref:Fe2OG dioxygenase domain-containing protein n=1 Tax=Riccia sorocarpa TaxID=122646 RepID=A0ABD3H670_9MARC
MAFTNTPVAAVSHQSSLRMLSVCRAKISCERIEGTSPAGAIIPKLKCSSLSSAGTEKARGELARRIKICATPGERKDCCSIHSPTVSAMRGFGVLEEESIKILDMGSYFSGDDDRVMDFCEQLRRQCHEVGFFYVRNHGVPEKLCDRMLELGRKFFDLPTEVKMQMDYTKSPQFRGYMRIGAENTAGITDFREQIELGPEESQDIDFLDREESGLVYPLYRRLRGPNQWPPDTLLPGFKRETELFMEKMNELSMHIMQALALSLGLQKNYFDSSFQYMPHYQMKVVKYPPQPASDCAEDVGMFGVGAHSDSGFLSLLLQDDVGGLQAKNTAGRWIDVPPEKGTFVVNLGEMLQLATGGYYLATVHRVVSQVGSRSRYSVPFFFNPKLDTDIRAFNMLENSNQAEGRRFRSPTENSNAFGGLSTHGGKNKLLPVFGQNAFKSFARSHVNVVRQHHKDLVKADGSVDLDKLDVEVLSS